MTTLRFMSWNWNCFSDGRNHRKLDLIRRKAPHVVALQEIDSPAFEAIDALRKDWALVVPPLWDHPTASRDPKGQRLPSTALMIRRELSFVPAVGPAFDAWESAPSRAGLGFGAGDERPMTMPEPRSILGAYVRVGGRDVLVVSAHPPHAAGRGDDRIARILRKRRTYEVLRQYVRGTTAVVGMDANAWIDPEPEDDSFGGALQPLAARTRDLPELDQTDIGLFLENGFVDGEADEAEPRDALRIWLEADEERRKQILQRRPFGPWAITYNRSSNFARPDRRDLVMVSKDVKVLEVEHSYEDSLAAGSDHSYVLCDLEI